MQQKPLLIVGLDPGATSAYALLDLNGNVIKTNSSKDFTLSQIIEEAISSGIPVITAADVSRAPSTVHEFHRRMGTSLILPEQDLLKTEKSQLAKRSRFSNWHERDALAAANYAFKTLKPLLNRIDKFLEQKKQKELEREMKKIVLTKNLSPHATFNMLSKGK